MDPDQDRPWVPRPRAGGEDTGDAWFPVVPAPRAAPTLEQMPGRVATLTERPAAPTAAVVPVAPRSAALAVRDAGLPGLLSSWRRAVVRLVGAAVDGFRSVIGLLVAAPASR
ncbi:hypothetical protein Acsp06_28360 [Actinomycetospora sp. NBRC 106375]|uniref:hypothetical protein n=1 Tax=Actinomycetospora sp. NBRC 106375 TaxID=3032207 RepID=UPI0024A5A702|nr:hypothetical protein [Actinomycetospora sp. NBRC 106375]GLZ46651.1 hypothetical protein Acsp06_28360 [Actinomycetospora sp. NBRC 106375]